MMLDYPLEDAAKRKTLLEAVEQIKETLESNSEESEANGTLTQASVDALYDSGLLKMKVPAALGGAEADPVTQMDVIAAVTRIHPSAGWCFMIGTTSVALPGAFLPEQAVKQIFESGRIPTAATSFMPTGKATQVEGGFILDGRWRLASGVLHSQWLNAGAVVAVDGNPPDHHFSAFRPRRLKFTIPGR